MNKITIQEIIDNLESFDDKKREKVLRKLTNDVLCRVSLVSLYDLQENWDPKNNNYNDFVKKQNEIIIECLKIETTKVGNIVRESFDLDKLELDTEIEY